MTIIAFAGPSLATEDRDAFHSVDWRPPAEAGDLLELAGKARVTICLIDGYFDHRPAVRHKEILLLLAEGATIYGASSIGALRAAEMDGFGLRGIGAIYRAYARGTITGDDEVALVHGTAEAAWRPMSVPLVDVRATLCAGLRRGALRIEAARALLRSAAAAHYVDRNWEEVLNSAELPKSSRGPIKAWLAHGQVAQKRLDARACLSAALTDRLGCHPRPPMVRTAFVEALARERGLTLPAPDRADRTATPRAPHSGTGCDRGPIA